MIMKFNSKLNRVQCKQNKTKTIRKYVNRITTGGLRTRPARAFTDRRHERLFISYYYTQAWRLNEHSRFESDSDKINSLNFEWSLKTCSSKQIKKERKTTSKHACQLPWLPLVNHQTAFRGVCVGELINENNSRCSHLSRQHQEKGFTFTLFQWHVTISADEIHKTNSPQCRRRREISNENAARRTWWLLKSSFMHISIRQMIFLVAALWLLHCLLLLFR